MRNRPAGPAGCGRRGWLYAALTVLALTGVIGAIVLWRNFAPLAEGSLVVNINTASKRELQSLPGIGPALAELTIAGRPFRGVDDLARVHGVSARQVGALRPMLTVSEPTRELSVLVPFESALRTGWASTPRVTLLLYASCILVALYYAVPWVRRRWQECRNARTRADLAATERRRWEGHRRE